MSALHLTLFQLQEKFRIYKLKNFPTYAEDSDSKYQLGNGFYISLLCSLHVLATVLLNTCILSKSSSVFHGLPHRTCGLLYARQAWSAFWKKSDYSGMWREENSSDQGKLQSEQNNSNDFKWKSKKELRMLLQYSIPLEKYS